jgi:hypothetical protein
MDSLMIVELAGRLESSRAISLPNDVYFGGRSILDIGRLVAAGGAASPDHAPQRGSR